jgi:hypothetical protein
MKKMPATQVAGIFVIGLVRCESRANAATVKVADGSAAAKSNDDMTYRSRATVRCCDDGELPININWAKNQIPPIAIGQSNLLFAGAASTGDVPGRGVRVTG